MNCPACDKQMLEQSADLLLDRLKITGISLALRMAGGAERFIESAYYCESDKIAAVKIK